MQSDEGHTLTIRKDSKIPRLIEIRLLYSDESMCNIADIEEFFSKKGFKSTSYGGSFETH